MLNRIMSQDRLWFILSSIMMYVMIAALLAMVVFDIFLHSLTFPFAGLFALGVEFTLLLAIAVSAGSTRYYLLRLRGDIS
jgi:hypothetical protein